MGDLLSYRVWMRSLTQHGLADAYWPAGDTAGFALPVDYPPVLPYLLRAIGAVLPARALASDSLVDFLIRVPSVLANVLMGALIALEARRTAGRRVALLSAALFVFNPAVLFHTCYWGQTDALWTLFVLASLVALGRRQPEWACIWVVLAALTKPLAYPYVALVLVAMAAAHPAARVGRAVMAGAVAAAALLAPFAVVHRLGRLLHDLVLQVDAMPYASVNAHNLWWLVGAGLPWREARRPWIGALSPAMAGLGLFAIFFAVTLSRLWRSRDPRAPWLAAAGLALGFFVLSTHMHENHLFPFLPLVAALGLGDRRLRGVYLVVSATFLANMALHDPYLGHALRDHGFGPGVVLRPPAELSPATARFLEASGYAYLIDEATRPASLGWIVLSLLNSLANVAAFVWWSFAFYRGRSFDAALAAAPPPSTVEARGFARWAVP